MKNIEQGISKELNFNDFNEVQSTV